MNGTEDRKRELLARLPGVDFVPPDEWLDGLAALPPSERSLRSAARESERAIDEFAREYWKLGPLERRVRWTELKGLKPNSTSAAFIEHLERGLDLESLLPRDPLFDSFVNALSEAYLLRPRARAVYRLVWSHHPNRPWASGWTGAILGLRRSEPELAVLEGDVGPVAFPIPLDSWPGLREQFGATEDILAPPEPPTVKSKGLRTFQICAGILLAAVVAYYIVQAFLTKDTWSDRPREPQKMRNPWMD